jgi:hypothetical protein
MEDRVAALRDAGAALERAVASAQREIPEEPRRPSCFDTDETDPRKEPTMPPLPTISGRECVRALLPLGFRVTGEVLGYVEVKRGPRSLCVPQDARLPPEELDAILRAAGVSPFDFLLIVGRVRMRDTFPDDSGN